MRPMRFWFVMMSSVGLDVLYPPGAGVSKVQELVDASTSMYLMFVHLEGPCGDLT